MGCIWILQWDTMGYKKNSSTFQKKIGDYWILYQFCSNILIYIYWILLYTCFDHSCWTWLDSYNFLMHHLAPHNCWELLRSHGFNLANQWVAATKRSGKTLSEPLKIFVYLGGFRVETMQDFPVLVPKLGFFNRVNLMWAIPFDCI